MGGTCYCNKHAQQFAPVASSIPFTHSRWLFTEHFTISFHWFQIDNPITYMNPTYRHVGQESQKVSWSGLQIIS